MTWTIAIQPDDYTNPSVGKPDASSPRWAELLQTAGHQVRWVDVYQPDILQQLQGCHGFMWRWGHCGGMYRVARRLLPVIERELGLPTYPDQNTCWHYDDKIAQWYLLSAAGIPVPTTWVWYDERHAIEWARTAIYPLVLKLWGGAASTNVRLITSFEEAKFHIAKLFDNGVYSLDDMFSKPWKWGIQRFRSAVKLALTGIPPRIPWGGWELHKSYVFFQEFLPNNDFDTRVTVIGNRAFAFRRFNRDNDFRASGSGKIDYNPQAVDPAFIRLAFTVASKLKTQSCAIDGLYDGKEPVVGEISYTYVSWAIHDCPGHWELDGLPQTGNLVWKEGRMWPEEAQIQDFLERLARHYAR